MLMRGDLGAACVLISMGAMLGKVNSFQLIVMAFIELIFYALNEYIAFHSLAAADIGGKNCSYKQDPWSSMLLEPSSV